MDTRRPTCAISSSVPRVPGRQAACSQQVASTAVARQVSVGADNSAGGCLGTGLCPPVPVHPQLRNPGLPGLAEECATRLHPLPGASAAEYDLELGGKPGTGGIDLTGRYRDLRLVVGDVTPVLPDRLASLKRFGERGLDEDGVGGEGRENRVDVGLRPATGEGIHQVAGLLPGDGWWLRRGHWLGVPGEEHTCIRSGQPGTGGLA